MEKKKNLILLEEDEVNDRWIGMKINYWKDMIIVFDSVKNFNEYFES